jgi:hypothetical protein
MRKVKLRGLAEVDWLFVFAGAAFNVMRATQAAPTNGMIHVACGERGPTHDPPAVGSFAWATESSVTTSPVRFVTLRFQQALKEPRSSLSLNRLEELLQFLYGAYLPLALLAASK